MGQLAFDHRVTWHVAINVHRGAAPNPPPTLSQRRRWDLWVAMRQSSGWPHVSLIPRGANPTDLQVQAPSKFELVINRIMKMSAVGP